MIWIYFFSRTSTLAAKLGNPATVLLLQKLNCHPGERVSSDLEAGGTAEVY